MKDSEKIFQNLKEDISAYINLKLELLKLNTYEKSGKIISLLSYGFSCRFRDSIHLPVFGIFPG